MSTALWELPLKTSVVYFSLQVIVQLEQLLAKQGKGHYNGGMFATDIDGNTHLIYHGNTLSWRCSDIAVCTSDFQCEGHWSESWSLCGFFEVQKKY